jgi:prepilin-type N-terminal cleavage/methylation domain-containing protein
MKTIRSTLLLQFSRTHHKGFTLTELLVVIAVFALLISLQVPTLAKAARRTKVAQCADNVRRITLALHIAANENKDRLPIAQGGAWAWDLPAPIANAMLSYGLERSHFYCPGTAPRFDDNVNFLNAGASSLWNFASPTFRIIGYSLALSGPSSLLILSNQNSSILPEPVRVNGGLTLPAAPANERVLVADATISENLSQDPAAAGSFTRVAGGFLLPHLSPHLTGTRPAGGNLGFKDGHVAWRRFADMDQRAVSGRGFWW